MAIWGLETSYGTVTGSTDLLQALASLGYYGRRRDLFENEFVATLKLMDQGVPRWRLKGSWAGATGYPQFMPSVVAALARRRRRRRIFRHLDQTNWTGSRRLPLTFVMPGGSQT